MVGRVRLKCGVSAPRFWYTSLNNFDATVGRPTICATSVRVWSKKLFIGSRSCGEGIIPGTGTGIRSEFRCLSLELFPPHNSHLQDFLLFVSSDFFQLMDEF